MHIIGGKPLSYIPSDKSPEMESLLTSMFGFDRREVIKAGLCAPKPIGCGEPIGPFRDALSEKEYTISSLCQTCQDTVFAELEEFTHCGGCGASGTEPCESFCDCKKYGCP